MELQDKVNKVTALLDKDLVVQIDVYAKQNDLDRSKVIRKALKTFFLNANPVKQPAKKTLKKTG